MKKLIPIFIFLLICSGVKGQKHNCDLGWSYMPTIGTTSLIIEADTCLPDSVCDKLWRMYSKNLCGETSSAMGELSFYDSDSCENCLSYSNQNTWDDSLGCSNKETWQVVKNNKLIEITKKQYDSISKIKDRRQINKPISHIDSAAFYRRKYLYFKNKYTNSIGFKEVKRLGDSCRKYYELSIRKK